MYVVFFFNRYLFRLDWSKNALRQRYPAKKIFGRLVIFLFLLNYSHSIKHDISLRYILLCLFPRTIKYYFFGDLEMLKSQRSGRRGLLHLRVPPEARGSRGAHRHLLPAHPLRAAVRRVRPRVRGGGRSVCLPGHHRGSGALLGRTTAAVPEDLQPC